MDSAKASNPPSYTILDSGNPEAQFATDIGQMIISRYTDAEGHLDLRQLRQTLDMVVRYVEDKTGVLPSVSAPPASGKPPTNNPIEPDKWDWSKWERKYVPGDGIRDMKYSHRALIGKILGANLQNDVHKIRTILEHTLFKTSVKSEISSSSVKFIVHSAKNCGQALELLFRHFEYKQAFSPTGMIKAAIALGYIPKEDIQQLYDMSKD